MSISEIERPVALAVRQNTLALRSPEHPIPVHIEIKNKLRTEIWDFGKEGTGESIGSINGRAYLSRTVKKNGTLVKWRCNFSPQLYGQTVSDFDKGVEQVAPGMQAGVVEGAKRSLPFLEIDSESGISIVLPSQNDRKIQIQRFPKRGASIPLTIKEIAPDLVIHLRNFTPRFVVVLGQGDIDSTLAEFHRRIQGGALTYTGARDLIFPVFSLDSTMTRGKK